MGFRIFCPLWGCGKCLKTFPPCGHVKNPGDRFKPGRKLWNPEREKRGTGASNPG